jgi:hypothetical protein
LKKFLDLLSKILEKEKRRIVVGAMCALVLVSLFVKVKFGWGGEAREGFGNKRKVK